jgi:hypothetical protein
MGSVGVAKISQGTYQTLVQKMDETNVLVRITKLHVDTLSVQAGATVVSVGASKFEQLSNGMSYKIDISSEHGKMAYHDLIHGNVAAIEKLTEQKVDYVKKWDSLTSKQMGRMKNFFFGLPIVLNTTTSEGKIYEVDHGNVYNQGLKTKAHYAVYLKDKKTKVFNKHFEKTQSFYGAFYDVSNEKNEKKTSGHFGQFKWSAETDASTNRRLGNAIEDLVKITGIRDPLLVNLPDERKLGYTDIDFSMTITEEQTKKMISNAEMYGQQKVAKSAAEKAKAYFSILDDSDGICTVASPGRTQNNCESIIADQSYNGAEEMVSKLLLMKKYWNDEKLFVKHYADFGKIMARNQFLFQTAIDLAGANVTMNYSIQGRNISNYQMNFTTTDKLGTFVKRKGSFDSSQIPQGPHGHDLPREIGVIITPSKPGVIIPIHK